MERQAAILYPEPATKVFLDAVRVKLFASGSKASSSPKALASRRHQQEGMQRAFQLHQMLSRQPFASQNKDLMNQDLSFSGDSPEFFALPNLRSTGRKKSIGLPT